MYTIGTLIKGNHTSMLVVTLKVSTCLEYPNFYIIHSVCGLCGLVEHSLLIYIGSRHTSGKIVEKLLFIGLVIKNEVFFSKIQSFEFFLDEVIGFFFLAII